MPASKLAAGVALATWLMACGDQTAPSGVDAPPGIPPDAAISILQTRTVLPPSATCEFGAARVDQGADLSHDGVLDASEVTSSTTACLTEPEPSLIKTSGLSAPPINQTCVPPTGASQSSGVTTTAVFTNVQFPANSDCLPGINTTSCRGAFRPVVLRQQPITRRFYVAEQPGRIIAIEGTTATLALDLRNKVVFGYEPGLLNLDFDPANGGIAYVSYVTCGSQSNGIITNAFANCIDGFGGAAFLAVSRFTVRADGSFDETSEQLIIEQSKPTGEHNGGGAQFGPDGNLFVAIGDGGEYPSDAAQDPSTLRGKIIRISVNSSPGVPRPTTGPIYGIPSDNPFRTVPGIRPEIYAMGFRNPWRYSFDPLTTTLPRLWVGDVGLISAEEVNYVQAGKNYGWPIIEGPFCHHRGADVGKFSVSTDTTCLSDPRYTAPVHFYRQAHGVAITGGMVYRGTAIPRLRGSYLFADFSLGHIWSLTGVDNTVGFIQASGMLLSSFGEDLDHELYVMDWWTGEIRQLQATAAVPARPATLLSATGCVQATAPQQPAAGALAYDVNVGFFSEAAVHKQRYLFLPSSGGGLTEYDNTGTLILQPGSVLMKDFDINGRRIETRLMYFQPDATWTMWSYKWLADQSDAVLQTTAEDVDYDGVAWHLPNQGECVHCHNMPNGGVLALRIEQLNRLHYYPETNSWANQLDTLRAVGRINRVEPIDRMMPIGAQNARIVDLPPAQTLPHLPRLADTAEPLVARVGAYLETNCSYCHRPAGGGRGEFSLVRSQFLAGLCNQLPQSAAYDDPAMRLIKPGDAEHSIVLRRMQETQLPYQMHPYRMTADAQGVALLKEWIETTAAADCAAVQ